MVAFLVGCGGGETSYDGTYKMVLKQGEKEMTLTLELNPDNTFVGTNSNRKGKVNGKWKFEGDELVCTGKVDNSSNEDITIKFNKDSLAAKWFGSNDKNFLDDFLKQAGFFVALPCAFFGLAGSSLHFFCGGGMSPRG